MDGLDYTFDVDYGSTLVFEFTPAKGGMVLFWHNTSDRRVTWKKTSLSNGVERLEAKIYNNITITAMWSKSVSDAQFQKR